MANDFELRAHDSVFDRLDELALAAVPQALWDAALELLHRVMTDPDSCRWQAIRWPRSEVSGYRVSAFCGAHEVQVWWSLVSGKPFVWGLTFEPPLDP